MPCFVDVSTELCYSAMSDYGYVKLSLILEH